MVNFLSNERGATNALVGSTWVTLSTLRRNLTAGSACAGVHHKLLHGSGVAFCHNIVVKLANVHSKKKVPDQVHDDDTTIPDINQPVLLEIQAIGVHGVTVKVMFDNGSFAALVGLDWLGRK